MRLMESLKADDEIKRLKEEWNSKLDEPFWPYNYDEYAGIEDYKSKIKQHLKNNRTDKK